MIDRCRPLTGDTPNTTRLSGVDQYQLAAVVSQAVWFDPTDPSMRPGAVMLARGDDLSFQDAVVGSPLIHFPRNGPVLLTEPTRLSPTATEELLRLSPTGEGSPAQVITVGSLSPAVAGDVESLGFSVFRIEHQDPVETAARIWEVLENTRLVLIVSAEDFAEALPAAGWAAHSGDPVLLTYKDRLPAATARVVRQRRPDVYIVGSERTVSRGVEKELRHLTHGLVERIGGRTPYEVAINFTRYRSPRGDFGWGIRDRKGWSFRFARGDDWYGAVAGAPLSHAGKHSPLLTVHPSAIPASVCDYLEAVNPRHREPGPPYMHGFVVGNTTDVSCGVQDELDRRLETVVMHS